MLTPGQGTVGAQMAGEPEIGHQRLIKVIQQNVERAKQVIANLAKLVAAAPAQISAQGEMAHAIMTAKDKVTPDARRRLAALVQQYLG